MNYNENGLKNRQNSLNKTNVSNTVFVVISLFFAVCFLFFIYNSCIQALSSFVRVMNDIQDITTMNLRSDGKKTVVLDTNGQVIQYLFSSYEDSTYVYRDEISDSAKNAFIAYFDPNFYNDNELNIDSMISDIKNEYYSSYDNEYETTGIKMKRTITQRLLQNQMFYMEAYDGIVDRIKSNIKEQVWAMQLQNNVHKESVLEMFLNTINFGNNVVGIQDAAQKYFEKNASELSAAETSVLIPLSIDANAYDPILKQKENSRIAKNVLKSMLTNEFITESEYEDALGDNVYTRISPSYSKANAISQDAESCYINATVKKIISDLMNYSNLTQTQAYNAVYRGGLSIYTCQNKDIQERCNEILNDDSNYPEELSFYVKYNLECQDDEGTKMTYAFLDLKSYAKREKKKKISHYFSKKKDAEELIQSFEKYIKKSGYKILDSRVNITKQPQSSLVLIDHTSGKVEALIGGRNQDFSVDNLNRASVVLRQPGTVLSSLAVYAPALDYSNYTLSSIQNDTIYKFPDRTDEVQNYDEFHKGLVTMRKSIRDNVCVSAVKFLDDISYQTGFDFLSHLGISSIVKSGTDINGNEVTDLNSSLAIGTMVNGISNLELTNAYATIANGGTYNEPLFYTRVLDKKDNVIFEKENKKTRVMRESSAWLLTSAFEDSINEGYAKKSKLEDSSMACAGQAGTNETNTDYWFEGYTPYYTCGVWLGNDEGLTLDKNKFAGNLWKKVMSEVIVYKHEKNVEFSKPADIIERTVCNKSGLLSIPNVCGSENSGAKEYVEYYRNGTEPTKSCDCHVSLKIDKNTNKLATNETKEEDISERTFIVKSEVGLTLDSPYLLTHELKKEMRNNGN